MLLLKFHSAFAAVFVLAACAHSFPHPFLPTEYAVRDEGRQIIEQIYGRRRPQGRSYIYEWSLRDF